MFPTVFVEQKTLFTISMVGTVIAISKVAREAKAYENHWFKYFFIILIQIKIMSRFKIGFNYLNRMFYDLSSSTLQIYSTKLTALYTATDTAIHIMKFLKVCSFSVYNSLWP